MALEIKQNNLSQLSLWDTSIEMGSDTVIHKHDVSAFDNPVS